MSDTLIIFNPMTNHGRSGQRASDLRPLIEELGGADWAGTEYPGHAIEIAAQAADKGHTHIVVLGGDGTIHEAINGLMRAPVERRPSLGIVPMGSGNDFAGGLNLSPNPAQAIQRAMRGSLRPIDVAEIKDESGRVAYFNNSCGLGFDAAANIRTRKLTYLHGFAMYLTAVLQTILFNFEAPMMKVQDDSGTVEQPITMLTIGNGNRQGGGFRTTPEARPDDGLLDFVYIHRVSQLRMLYMLIRVMQVAHTREPDVTLKTTKRLVIDADRAIPIHTDGELFAPYEANIRHVEITVVPGAVRLVM
jgi:YegS/Rv2252/BmrU family lipid kinase